MLPFFGVGRRVEDKRRKPKTQSAEKTRRKDVYAIVVDYLQVPGGRQELLIHLSLEAVRLQQL